MTRYKIAVLFSTILMGIASIMACLSDNANIIMAGNILLIISILIMYYGYSSWQP